MFKPPTSTLPLKGGGDICCLSPAKLNLFLHITGQRADGYHLLQTVMQFVDFGDHLTFRRRQDSQILIKTNHPDLNHPDNLILKAAKVLQVETKTSSGCDIQLQKRIPIGGGLGGGSSNAATTLLALNKLWQLRLTLSELTEIGLKLGADIPFFIQGHSAWVEGIGEKIYPIVLPEPWFVIVTPHHTTISTQEIYQHPQLTRHTESLTIRKFHPGMGHNDCEPLVCQLKPVVARALEELSKYTPARMTGTGSSVFATFPEQGQAQKVAKQLAKDYSIIVAKGLNRSPVYDEDFYTNPG